jgi:hypothetical protein
MNKRIQELFDQTLEQFNEEHKDAPYRAMFIVPDPVKEKFAELIVQECVEQIQICSEQIKNDDGYADDNIWPIMQSIVDAVAIDVKEHFGVAESKREKIDKAMRAAFKDGVDLSGKETP